MAQPSTSVRSKFLRTIPLNSFYKDPRNHHVYQVVEKNANGTLIKAAVIYHGNDIDPIILDNIPDSMLKIENPIKSNPNKLLKSKILSLEEKYRSLLQHQFKSLYHRLKELLDDNYYESDDTFYLLHSGLVLPFRKKYYPTLEDAQTSVDDMAHRIFTDSKVIGRVFEKQHKLQAKLFKMVMEEEDNSDDIKDILLS